MPLKSPSPLQGHFGQQVPRWRMPFGAKVGSNTLSISALLPLFFPNGTAFAPL
jgi:hypothetical protein